MSAAAPSPKTIHGVPKPPPDLSVRTPLVKTLDLGATPLWRIHRAVHGAIYYNKPSSSGTRFRFDAPASEYGVLYASESVEACLMETVFRDRWHGAPLPYLLDEHELSSRRLTRLLLPASARRTQLRLLDLTGDLFGLGMDGRVMTVEPYDGSCMWSKAIHDAFPALDGIYFTARFANAPSVAIFDRTTLTTDTANVFALHTSLAVGAVLDKHDIMIAPT